MSTSAATIGVVPGAKPTLWEQVKSWKIGVVPWPVFLLLASVVVVAGIFGKLPKDMIGGFSVILVAGIFLGHVGNRLPGLNKIGGAAILCLFVPSALAYYGGPAVKVFVDASNNLMKNGVGAENFLYVYISCLVVGAILSMHRTVLLQGILKMFVPLVVATLAATAAGLGIAMLFGYQPLDAYLYILTPIFGGGIGEGIVPTSLGYSLVTGQSQDSYIAMLVPAALLGNVVAVISAGLLKRLGEKKPQVSGSGLLVRTGKDKELLALLNSDKPVDFPLMGAGMLMAFCFFLMGFSLQGVVGLPGPIIMIFMAVLIKILRIMPPRMEQGAQHMYKFMTGAFTYPLLVGLGIGYVPWGDMISKFTVPYFIICIATVVTLIVVSYFTARAMKMYEVETAMVTGCHASLGGSGDVAILSAGDRMGLMPFAQISTRIAGALTVTLSIIILRMIQS